MKKLLLLPCMMACSFQLWAQPSPPPGPVPALRLTKGSHITTTGGAYLVLHNMNVINDGTFKQASGDGFVQLTGDMNVSLFGGSRTVFDQLLMKKDPPVPASFFNLESDLDVVSKVNFSGGMINLGNHVLDLRNTGIFSLESEASRAFTTGLGYVQASGILNRPSGVDLGKLGAVITSNDNMGNTTVKRGHKEQTAISGSNNSILRYYDIEPTNNVGLKATLRFHYFDAELNGIGEAELYQWRSKDLVTWSFLGADARSVSENYVHKMNHSKFERMTLAKGIAPSISCPGNITVSSNSKGCKASVAFAATASGTPSPTITYRIGNSVITSPHVFSKGTTTVTATATNGVLPNSTCTFTVTVVCGPVNNLMITQSKEAITDDAPVELSLTARPNPTGYYFTVDIKSADLRPVNIRVVDASGRLVGTHNNIGANSTLFFGHKLRPGTYFMEAFQGRQRAVLKLMKSMN